MQTRTNPVIPMPLLYPYLGQMVVVVLHNGATYHRRLVGVSLRPSCKITLDKHRSRLGNRRLLHINPDDIRLFGTQKDGVLKEVWEQ